MALNKMTTTISTQINCEGLISLGFYTVLRIITTKKNSVQSIDVRISNTLNTPQTKFERIRNFMISTLELSESKIQSIFNQSKYDKIWTSSITLKAEDRKDNYNILETIGDTSLKLCILIMLTKNKGVTDTEKRIFKTFETLSCGSHQSKTAKGIGFQSLFDKELTTNNYEDILESIHGALFITGEDSRQSLGYKLCNKFIYKCYNISTKPMKKSKQPKMNLMRCAKLNPIINYFDQTFDLNDHEMSVLFNYDTSEEWSKIYTNRIYRNIGKFLFTSQLYRLIYSKNEKYNLTSGILTRIQECYIPDIDRFLDAINFKHSITKRILHTYDFYSIIGYAAVIGECHSETFGYKIVTKIINKVLSQIDEESCELESLIDAERSASLMTNFLLVRDSDGSRSLIITEPINYKIVGYSGPSSLYIKLMHIIFIRKYIIHLYITYDDLSIIDELSKIDYDILNSLYLKYRPRYRTLHISNDKTYKITGIPYRPEYNQLLIKDSPTVIGLFN